MTEPRRLDFVVGEFSPHNLPLQALLGLLGVGERVTLTLARLELQPEPAIEPGQHALDLALLGLLGLHDTLVGELERRGLSPSPVAAPELPVEPKPEPATETDALRRLLR